MKKIYSKPVMECIVMLTNDVLLTASIGKHDDETLGGSEFLSNQEGQMDIWE